jgi:hypothetical protein
MAAIKVRLEACLLNLHPDKSKIVYCKDSTILRIAFIDAPGMHLSQSALRRLCPASGLYF